MPIGPPYKAWYIAVPFLACGYFWQRYHSPTYLAFSACVLAGFLGLFLAWERLHRSRLGWVFLVAAAAGLTSLGLWQYFNLADAGDIDHASYICWLWALEHGTGESHFSEYNILGAHSNYAIFLWIPVHLVFGEAGIKIGKLVCLLAAVGLMAWRLRENRGARAERGEPGEPGEGAWLALAVLLSPSVASQFFFGFQPEFLAAPVLVLAMLAWRDERLGLFLACTAFIALNKEVFTLPIAGLLAVGLIERRPWKWIVQPAMLCCGLMALWWFVIGPYFSHEGVNHFHSGMPTGPLDAILKIFRLESLQYAVWVVLPFIPVLAGVPKRYLLIPVPMLAFYGMFQSDFREMWRHYTYPLPFLCAAGWLISRGRRSEGARPDGRILLACVVTAVLCFPMWRTVFSIPRGQGEKRIALAEIRRLVPENASITVNGNFTAWFASRRDLMAWEYKVKPLDRFDFVLMDEGFLPASNQGAEDLKRDMGELSDTVRWEEVRSGAGLHLFRNRAPMAPNAAPAP